MSLNVDWTALHDAATVAMRRAYAPYSSFPVGAAALVDDGRVVTGCNVENASHSLGLCAECGLVSELHVTGGGRLVAVVVVDRHGAVLTPCGRCRQLLWEHGGQPKGEPSGQPSDQPSDQSSGPALLVDTPRGVRTIAELLPDAFGPDDLRDRR